MGTIAFAPGAIHGPSLAGLYAPTPPEFQRAVDPIYGRFSMTAG